MHLRACEESQPPLEALAWGVTEHLTCHFWLDVPCQAYTRYESVRPRLLA